MLKFMGSQTVGQDWATELNGSKYFVVGKVPDAGKDWEGEEDVRGWDGWTASLMQWTWTWAHSGRWWGTERPSVLQSMGSQRVGHDWATKQEQSKYRPTLMTVFANFKLTGKD